MSIEKRERAHYVGAPGFFELNQACRTIADAYDGGVYLVGSSLRTRDYRDVDVRCILGDEEFDQMFPVSAGREAGSWLYDARWSLLCSLISHWLALRTGLKIDFQFQRRTQVNEAYLPKDGHYRNALGVFLEKSRPRESSSPSLGTDGVKS